MDLQTEEVDPEIVIVDLPDLLMVDMTAEEIVDKRIANQDSSSYSTKMIVNSTIRSTNLCLCCQLVLNPNLRNQSSSHSVVAYNPIE